MATESWDDYAAEWDDNEAVVDYSIRAFESLGNVADIEGRRIFDLGCGTGLLTAQIAQSAERVVALDPSRKMIEVLRSKNFQNVEAIVGELTEATLQKRPDFESGFDLIVASSVCAFLPDYHTTLGLLRRLLKTGGLLVQWDWFKSDEDQEIGFTEGELLVAYQESGLRTLSVSIPFGLNGEGREMKVIMCVGKNA